MRDISQAIGQTKIAQVVDVFYERAVLHPQLKAPFALVQDWTTHKQQLTHFWWLTLGGERYLDYQSPEATRNRALGLINGVTGERKATLKDVVMRKYLPGAN